VGLSFRILKKRRLFLHSTVASGGPICVNLTDLVDSPFEKEVLLMREDIPVGKIYLALSAMYDPSYQEALIESMHISILEKLSSSGATMSGDDVMASHDYHLLSCSNTSLSEMTEESDDSDPANITPDTMLGYRSVIADDEYSLCASSQPDVEASAGSSDDSLNESERIMSDFYTAWKHLQQKFDIAKMVDSYFTQYDENGKSFPKDWARRKEEITNTLEIVLASELTPSILLPNIKKLVCRDVTEWNHQVDFRHTVFLALLESEVEIMQDLDPALFAQLLRALRIATLAETTIYNPLLKMREKRFSVSSSKERISSEHHAYQFNQRFQDAVSNIWKKDQSMLAWGILADVCDDFEASAQTLGRIIISEQFMAEGERTIQPLEQGGGLIGGVKYCQQGIFFKLAIPDGKHVLTYEGAGKVAGHD